ncbi:MAG: hypothetical protein ACYC0F_13360 [Rhodanobacter sp.]
MKRFHVTLFSGMLFVAAGSALASSGSLNEFRPRVMPVLVQVNSHGKVTGASPATELSPRLDRLLRQNLDELIGKPATDRNGRAMPSQFVINLALQVSPREDGDYDARFAYVSTSPVPPGSWYWVHVDGHRLALASQDSFNRGRRVPFGHGRAVYRPMNGQGYRPASIPPIRNTVRSASGSSPARAPGHDR